MLDDSISRIIELARHVRTQEGADLYGKPIGTIIGSGTSQAPHAGAQNDNTQLALPQDAPARTTGGPTRVGKDAGDQSKRPVTIERLKSLQSQLRIAMKTDNEAAINTAKKAFQDAFTELAKSRDPKVVLSLLTGGKQ